jgi:hypothetical protein
MDNQLFSAYLPLNQVRFLSEGPTGRREDAQDITNPHAHRHAVFLLPGGVQACRLLQFLSPSLTIPCKKTEIQSSLQKHKSSQLDQHTSLVNT